MHTRTAAVESVAVAWWQHLSRGCQAEVGGQGMCVHATHMCGQVHVQVPMHVRRQAG
jgi:hypothetical protein